MQSLVPFLFGGRKHLSVIFEDISRFDIRRQRIQTLISRIVSALVVGRALNATLEMIILPFAQLWLGDRLELINFLGYIWLCRGASHA